jgi:surface antigen
MVAVPRSRSVRLWFGVAGILTALVVVAVVTSPGSASATGPCENETCPNGAAWLDAMGGTYWNQYSGHNCTNYVAWRQIGNGIPVFQPGGDAEAWARGGAAAGIRVDDEPSVGAVAHWGAGEGGHGSAGHVAYVEEVTDTEITVSEDSYSEGPFRWRTIPRGDAAAPPRYIHFEDRAQPRFESFATVGDFSGDGNPDLAAISTAGDLHLYAGDGVGGFPGVGAAIAASWGAFAGVRGPGDLSGDGLADLIAVSSTGVVTLFPGDGAGGFGGGGVPLATGWGAATIITPGDFTGDGRADVLTLDPGGRLVLHTGNGASGFEGPGVLLGESWDTFTAVLGAGDLSGDGRADLIAVSPTGIVTLYPGNGAGGFLGAGWPVATGWDPAATFLAPGDVTGDGFGDILALDGDGGLTLHAGNGGGGFSDARAAIDPPWSR